MPRFLKGDLYRESKADLRIFTGNSSVNQRGELVMGRGAAAQVKEMYPGIDKELGQRVSEWKLNNPGTPYVGMLSNRYPGIGVMQVKHGFSEMAQLDLIEMGVRWLTLLAQGKTEGAVAVNFPGKGYGGLQRSVVLPYLEPLPDNVEIWEYKWDGRGRPKLNPESVSGGLGPHATVVRV